VSRPLIGISSQRRDWQGAKGELYGQIFWYSEGVSKQGGLPVMLPLSLADDELRELYERLDAVVLTGGGDIAPHFFGSTMTEQVLEVDEDRDRIEINLARWAVVEEKPLLAICRGVQVLNVALGGTLIRDIETEIEGSLKHNYYPDYPRDHIAHDVQIDEECQLAHILGTPIVGVNSLHHQALLDIAPELCVVAHAPDGVIEAAEVGGHPYALGVQWHPEWMLGTAEMPRLFAGLVQASQNGAEPA